MDSFLQIEIKRGTYLKPHEVDVLVEVLLVAVEVLEAELDLFGLRFEARRDEAVDAQRLALGQRERHALRPQIFVFSPSRQSSFHRSVDRRLFLRFGPTAFR